MLVCVIYTIHSFSSLKLAKKYDPFDSPTVICKDSATYKKN